MFWLFVLNFLALQWFGVRLERHALYALGLRRPVRVEWRLRRWVWPLTGWRPGFCWIARVS